MTGLLATRPISKGVPTFYHSPAFLAVNRYSNLHLCKQSPSAHLFLDALISGGFLFLLYATSKKMIINCKTEKNVLLGIITKSTVDEVSYVFLEG